MGMSFLQSFWVGWLTMTAAIVLIGAVLIALAVFNMDPNRLNKEGMFGGIIAAAMMFGVVALWAVDRWLK